MLSQALETAIGLVFIFVLFSLLCSTIYEMGATLFKLRAIYLENGVEKLLGNSDFKKKFYNHFLINSFGRRKKDSKLPSYISAQTFSLVITDILSRDNQSKKFDGISDSIISNFKASENNIYSILAIFSDNLKNNPEIKNDFDKIKLFRESIEKFFDDSMERLSGEYKRNAQIWIFVISLAVVFALNLDTFSLGDTLWKTPALRENIVNIADKMAEDNEIIKEVPKETKRLDQELYNQIKKIQTLNDKALQLPIGWTDTELEKIFIKGNFSILIFKIFGLLLTVFLLSLGAPFWFDLLNQLINLRGTGEKPEIADKTAKKY